MKIREIARCRTNVQTQLQKLFTIYIEGMQQLCKLKPSMHLPIVRTAAALRAMFWLGFPWARSHKTPDMERPLVPYPKRSVRPCKTGNNELCIMVAKEYNPKTSSTQQWTISKFKSIYTSTQDVQHALSAMASTRHKSWAHSSWTLQLVINHSQIKYGITL